tara:strand:- start:79 stop:450 length:372 start_codon:yes stop_codon:yes gene_type:complete
VSRCRRRRRRGGTARRIGHFHRLSALSCPLFELFITRKPARLALAIADQRRLFLIRRLSILMLLLFPLFFLCLDHIVQAEHDAAAGIGPAAHRDNGIDSTLYGCATLCGVCSRVVVQDEPSTA